MSLISSLVDRTQPRGKKLVGLKIHVNRNFTKGKAKNKIMKKVENNMQEL